MIGPGNDNVDEDDKIPSMGSIFRTPSNEEEEEDGGECGTIVESPMGHCGGGSTAVIVVVPMDTDDSGTTVVVECGYSYVRKCNVPRSVPNNTAMIGRYVG